MKKIKGKPEPEKGYLLVYLSGECFVCAKCNSDNKKRDIKIYLKQFLEDISCRNAVDLNHQWIRKELKDALKLAKIEQSQEEEIFSNYLVYYKGSIFGSDLDLVQTNEQLDIYDGKKICCSIQLYKKHTWVYVAILLVTILLIGLLFMILANNGDSHHNDSPLNVINSPLEKMENESNVHVEHRIPSDFVFLPADTLLHCSCVTNYHYFPDYGEYYYDDHIYKDIPIGEFYICNHEVTQKEYKSIMGEMPEQDNVGDSLPVMYLSVREMIVYCNNRSQLDGYIGCYSISGDTISYLPDGKGYRLPMQEEWLYAARGGVKKQTEFIATNNLLESAWYGRNSNKRPHNVATKNPNSIGMFDMEGNASEVVMSIYHRKKTRQLGITTSEIYCSFENYLGYYEGDYYSWGVWPKTESYDHTFTQRDLDNEDYKEWYNDRGFRVVLVK